MKKVLSILLILSMVLAFAGCGNSKELTGGYYIDEIEKSYQYELKMSGTLPNAANPISFYVYTDDPDLSFSEVSQAFLSSQKTDLDFYISEYQIEKAD